MRLFTLVFIAALALPIVAQDSRFGLIVSSIKDSGDKLLIEATWMKGTIKIKTQIWASKNPNIGTYFILLDFERGRIGFARGSYMLSQLRKEGYKIRNQNDTPIDKPFAIKKYGINFDIFSTARLDIEQLFLLNDQVVQRQIIPHINGTTETEVDFTTEQIRKILEKVYPSYLLWQDDTEEDMRNVG